MADWIWYPGDMELYHRLKQDFSRVERGVSWPAFWKSDGFRNRVSFDREFDIIKEETFTVRAVEGAYGYVQLKGKKFPFSTPVKITPGKHAVTVHIACIERFPAIYVEGETVISDGTWTVHDYAGEPLPVGRSRYFTDPDFPPTEWAFSEKEYDPVRVEAVDGGTLAEFETELTARLSVEGYRGTVYLGESRAEVLAREEGYFHCTPDPESGLCERTAVRFAFLPDCAPEDVRIRAIHQFVAIPRRMELSSEDKELSEIFRIAAHTFQLCSGVFFIDGIKRDRWIWGGDAYQSILVNRYLTADPEIEQRTLLALRGNDPAVVHVNTIVDYSMLWLLGVYEHYMTYGDKDFLRLIWPKMVSMTDLLLSQRDGDGFLVGRQGDWIYIDWADLDKEGPLCAEQMLLVRVLQVMGELSPLFDGEKDYKALAEELREKVDRFYWKEERGAYIDSFVSGKDHVTRHANIFAVLFDLADGARQKIILEKVLLNEAVPKITTPYFTFFELDALGKMGCLDRVMERFRSYWGGMLRLGAVTFWEEFDPAKPLEQQYEMYGDPFGKSLCHAWAASPIYLFAKYFIGFMPEEPGFRSYTLSPHLEGLSPLECTLPVGGTGETVTVRWDGKTLG